MLSSFRDRCSKIVSASGGLLLPFVVAATLGYIGFFEPLEDVVRAARYAVAKTPPSGKVVVVAVDDKSVRTFGGTYFSWAVEARAIEKIMGAGARALYFDRAFADERPTAEVAMLRDQIAKFRGSVFVGGMNEDSGKTVAPNLNLNAQKSIVSLSGEKGPFGVAVRLARAGRVSGRNVASLSASAASLLGRGQQKTGDSYEPDFSIDHTEIETISLADLLAPKYATERLRGRVILFGYTAKAFHDVHKIPFQGWVSGPHIQAIGIETLLSGNPRHMDFKALLALCAAYLIFMKKWFQTRDLLKRSAGLVVILLGTTALLGQLLILVDVVPALLFSCWILLAERFKQKSMVDNKSGFCNDRALSLQLDSSQILIAMLMTDYKMLVGSGFVESSAPLISAIERIVCETSSSRKIYHRDEYVYFCLDCRLQTSEVRGHLEGLERILKSGVYLNNSALPIKVRFGCDSSAGNRPSQRIAAASAAASLAHETHTLARWVDGTEWDVQIRDAKLLSEFQFAVKQEDVKLAYQPKVSAISGHIVGIEALIRWVDRTRGPIAASEVVAAFERSDSLNVLTWFVLEQAMKDMRLIHRASGGTVVSVNISQNMLLEPSFVPMTRSLLSRYAMRASWLRLEITEDSSIGKSDEIIAVMDQLIRMGVTFSIDDFGSGFSNLDQVSNCPIAEVKIDRSIVADIDVNPKHLILVRSSIEMIHDLGCVVVAEGVETEAVRAILEHEGCDQIQGYLTGKPMFLDQLLDAFLKEKLTEKLAV